MLLKNNLGVHPLRFIKLLVFLKKYATLIKKITKIIDQKKLLFDSFNLLIMDIPES